MVPGKGAGGGPLPLLGQPHTLVRSGDHLPRVLPRAAHHPRRPRFRLSASYPPSPPAALARSPFSTPPPREVSRLHTWAPGGPSSVGGEPRAWQKGLAGGLLLHTHEKVHLTSVEHGPVAELRPAALGS